MESDHPLRRALSLVLLAGLFFSTLDATAKYLVRDHALVLVVWARYAGQMLVVTPIAYRRGGPDFWRTRHLGLQLLRSFCLVSATMCFFGGLRFLPLAEASAITFLAPVIAVVLSIPILGERPTRGRWVAAAIGFIGILMLVRPGSAVFHPATLLLVGAAISNALYQLLTRKLPNDTPYTTLFFTPVVGTLALSFAVPYLGATPGEVRMGDVLYLVELGLLAGFGHWAFITAFLMAPASLLAPFTYTHMIWATMYGYVIFGQLPDEISALGMAIIVASGVGLVVHERRASALKP